MRKKQTEIIVDDETEANITETINSKGETVKRVNYTAKVKENEVTETDEETENQGENFDNENDNSFFNDAFEEIPKDKLDRMFDEIQELTEGNGMYFAKVTRQPDSLADNFFVRCGGEMPLGVFQFSMRDRFNFIPQLQKLNSNSGGYFNVLIFDQQQKPLEILVRYEYDTMRRNRLPIFRQVGCFNLLVPNPVTIQENGQQQNGEIGMLVKAIQDMQNNFQNQINSIINNKPRENEQMNQLMMMMLTKSVENTLNPPERKADDFSLTREIMQKEMFQMKMIGEIFKQPPPPPPDKEPTTLDTVQGLLNTPLVQETATTILNAAAMIIEAKMQEKQQGVIQNLPNEVVVNPQPNQIATATDNNEMKELLDDVIAELESDSVFDEKNEFLIELKNDFPTQTMMIESICKTQSFENVLQLLIAEADKVKPQNPFVEFLDVAETQKQNKYVWTERGNKLIKRLNEFYEFVKK